MAHSLDEKLLALVAEWRAKQCVTSDPAYGNGVDTGYQGAADDLEELLKAHVKEQTEESK